MKKIALVLAMLIALSACMLAFAACGEEETSSEAPAESQAESAAESKEEPAASSVEESICIEPSDPEEPSEEPSEEEPSEEPSEDEPAPAGDNLALGKTYEISTLYPNTAAASYPDEGGKSLTDGTKEPSSAKYSDPVWAGFNIGTEDFQANGYAYIIVDLGEKQDLSKFVITSGAETIGSGIKGIKTLEVLVSDDGKNFTSVGTKDAVDSTSVPFITVEVNGSASGRYVQFRFTGGANWMFISEVEVY